MNECPTCGRKIRGKICPYCDEELVDEESDGSGSVSADSAVPVFSCDERWQAEFIISALESEGIPAHQESSSSVAGRHGGDESPEITGDIAVMVDAEDADRAREIVESAQGDLDAER